jgi:exonuclease VII small subunit
MAVDKEAVVKLLEAFALSLETSLREQALLQGLFTAACRAKGLTDAEINLVLAEGRKRLSPRIAEESELSYQSLLGKLPQIVDLLESDQDEALRFLQEWTPKGPIH